MREFEARRRGVPGGLYITYGARTNSSNILYSSAGVRGGVRAGPGSLINLDGDKAGRIAIDDRNGRLREQGPFFQLGGRRRLARKVLDGSRHDGHGLFREAAERKQRRAVPRQRTDVGVADHGVPQLEHRGAPDATRRGCKGLIHAVERR